MTVLAGVASALLVAVLIRPASGRRRLIARPVAVTLRSPRAKRVHQLAAAVAGLAVLLVLGVPWGLPIAVVVFAGLPTVLARMEPASVPRRRERIVADLPLTVDLLAACLRAGRPPGDALAAVAAAVGGPLGARLTEVEPRLRLGAEPADAWAVLEEEPGCAVLSPR